MSVMYGDDGTMLAQCLFIQFAFSEGDRDHPAAPPANGLPRDLRHLSASRRGPFEGLGTDAAQMAAAAVTVVEHFNVIEDISAGHIPGFVDAFTDALFLQTAKKRFSHPPMLKS